ncbi:hypothetical protein SAMN04487982_116214 [Streptomyces sp. ok210]|nr:hypothetical protein SAMN04487982_116214 [Streptomyces sp. ok210]
MPRTEGADGYCVAVTENGYNYWGYTTIPKPYIECCPAELRSLSQDQLVMSAAFHEAGHAVAALRGGIPVVPVEIIVPRPCERCGAPKAGGGNQGLMLNVGTADDTLRMLAAGVEAEMLWAEDQGSVTDRERWAIELSGIDDQGIAREVADSCRASGWPQMDYGPPGPDPRPWNWPHQRQRARTAVRLWWPQVEAVASRLAHRRHLTPADITAALSP